MSEELIKDLVSIRKNGWFSQFHKVFRVADFTKDGLSEMFMYDLIEKDLHLYPMARDKVIKTTDENYAKFLVNFINSIGSEALVNTFTRALSSTKQEMEEHK